MMIELINNDCLIAMDDLIYHNVKVDAVICDIPYGTTQNKWDEIIPLDEMWDRLYKLIKKDGVIVLFSQCPFDKVLGYSNIRNLKYEWIWNKVSPTGHLNAKHMPMRKAEKILVFYNNKPTYNPQGLEYCPRTKKRRMNSVGASNYNMAGEENISEYKGYPTDIIEFKNENGLHPTQKPVKLMEYLINTYTNENDLVLDFTMGSGTTGVACNNLNRDFIGIELDERYFEIAKERIYG